jgi:S1-C subfamily serine protease
VPGDLLDLILIVMIAAFAVAGYRQGFIIGILSLVGFVGGVAAGALVAPAIARALSSDQSLQAFLALFVVFLAAVIGMLVASAVGVVVRSRVSGRSATVIDSLGGAAVNVVSLLVVAWLIGSLVSNNGPFPAISRQVNDSVVLRAVDGIMPRGTLTLPVFPPLRTLLSNGIYEQVFSEIGAETSPDLPPPNPAVLQSPALVNDEASIVKVTGSAPGCNTQIEGSGFVISPKHVLTNAHVVAGVTRAQLVTTASGRYYPAQVVLYDPNLDVAVLYVPGLNAPPLHFAGSAATGASAIVAGYPEDHGFTPEPGTVGHKILAYGPNIYGTQSLYRQIYTVRAVILRGNSGGPLLSPSGRVYGVVFAASTEFKHTGYALAASQVEGDARSGSHRYSAVSTQACQQA